MMNIIKNINTNEFEKGIKDSLIENCEVFDSNNNLFYSNNNIKKLSFSITSNFKIKNLSKMFLTICKYNNIEEINNNLYVAGKLFINTLLNNRKGFRFDSTFKQNELLNRLCYDVYTSDGLRLRHDPYHYSKTIIKVNSNNELELKVKEKNNA